MNRIDALLSRLAPDGVPLVELGTVGDVISGLSGKTKSDFSNGNARYVSYKNVYANPAIDLGAAAFVRVGPQERQNRLRIGDVIITGSSETADDVGMSSVLLTEPSEPLYLNSFCFALRPRRNDLLVPGFCKHLFRSGSIRAAIQKSADGVTRINVSRPRLMRIRIPIPPVEVQHELVRILDSFTGLEAELEAELVARRRQYAYYRDWMLDFRDSSIRRIPMGDLGAFIRGRRFTKDDVVEDGIASIHYGEIYTRYGVATQTTVSQVRADLAGQLRFAKPGDVVIAAVGETVEDVAKAVAWLGSDPVAIHDDTFAFRSELNPKFVAYWMQTGAFHTQKNRHVARAKVKRIGGGGLAKIEIPVPPVEEQARIVAILDAFDVLMNDPAFGIPAEIKARRAQYEYYRDKLLAFEGAVA